MIASNMDAEIAENDEDLHSQLKQHGGILKQVEEEFEAQKEIMQEFGKKIEKPS